MARIIEADTALAIRTKQTMARPTHTLRAATSTVGTSRTPMFRLLNFHAARPSAIPVGTAIAPAINSVRTACHVGGEVEHDVDALEVAIPAVVGHGEVGDLDGDAEVDSCGAVGDADHVDVSERTQRRHRLGTEVAGGAGDEHTLGQRSVPPGGRQYRVFRSRSPAETSSDAKETPVEEGFLGWARGDLNPHILSNTGT